MTDLPKGKRLTPVVSGLLPAARLDDASQYGRDTARACAEKINELRATRGEPLLELPPDTAQGKAKLKAYVNHGRWVVDCPCGSAQLASRTDPRFWCVECGNAWQDGKWARVDWPPDVDDIEGLLGQRPSPRNRNWTPSEDLMTLVAENVTHGLGA